MAPKIVENNLTRARERKLDAVHSLARAVAFANLDLQSPESRWETAAHYHDTQKTWLRVSCHSRFPDEFGRALRMKPKNRAAKVTSGPRQLVSLEFLESEDPAEKQIHMQSLLSNIIACNHRSVCIALERLMVTVWPGVVTAAADDWKPSRKWRHRLQIEVIYQSPMGYDELRYGVMLAGEAKLYHRLSHCRTCRRFIMAKTDRPVRYCANLECQPRGAQKSRGQAPSASAGYKRKQRERQERWDTHRDLIRAAQARPKPSAARLTKLVRQGEQLVAECFRWKGSTARQNANLVLEQARDQIAALLATSPSVPAQPSSRSPSASSATALRPAPSRP